MKIDAHQHFWRYNPSTHGWITDELARLRADFLPSDLTPHLEAQGIAGSIAVQAATEGENEFLFALAREAATNPDDRPVFGIVGWLDLTADDAAGQVAQFAATPLSVGLRHIVQDEPDPRFLDREDFRRGVRALADHFLVYEVLIRPPQLDAALRFVPDLPEVTMVLDHLGKPPIASRDLTEWRTGIRTLAESPHLSAKVSGLVTEARWLEWRKEDFREVLDVALEAFGAERLMLGSDWPVCLLAAEYEEVYAILEDWLAPLSKTERAAIEGKNAVRVYQLNTLR